MLVCDERVNVEVLFCMKWDKFKFKLVFSLKPVKKLKIHLNRDQEPLGVDLTIQLEDFQRER